MINLSNDEKIIMINNNIGIINSKIIELGESLESESSMENPDPIIIAKINQHISNSIAKLQALQQYIDQLK